MQHTAKQALKFLHTCRWPLFIAAAVALNAAIVIQVLGDEPAAVRPVDGALGQQAVLEDAPEKPDRPNPDLTLQLPPSQLPTLKNLPSQIAEAAPAPVQAQPAPIVPVTRLFEEEDETPEHHADAVAMVRQAVERLADEIDALSAELERLSPGDRSADYAQTRLTAITSAVQNELGDVVREDLSDQQRQELQTAAEAKLMPAIERFAAASGRLSPPEPAEDGRAEVAKVDSELAPPFVEAPEMIDDEPEPQALNSEGPPELVIK